MGRCLGTMLLTILAMLFSSLVLAVAALTGSVLVFIDSALIAIAAVFFGLVFTECVLNGD